MADDQEKTEEATSKKLEDARKKGNVPKSQDMAGFVTLLVGIVALVFLLSFMGSKVVNLYIYYHQIIGQELTRELFFKITLHTMLQVLLIIMPLAVCIMIAGVIANVMQFGFLFSTEPLSPKFEKINPIKGIANLFSLKKLIESVKIVLKVGAVFGVAFYFFLQFVKELPHTVFFSMFSQLLWLKEKMLILAGVMLLLFLLIAVADLFIVRFQYFKNLRMSKQEVKDEYKQMEGDPRVKGRIRQVQMQTARKRMMQNVGSADVVITNPTHYAVALRYDKEKEKAPVVLAKGVDHLALRIRQIATEHGIQIVENPPLARELYRVCDVDDQIPANLFQAVAEVLSFVYLGNKSKFANRLK
ncbi:flagellar export apparatus, flagellar biosynthetic protein FlhB [Campylobacter iguaniorum]|uniref:Flagellar biosynthetic protein FlhB n=1 Tax=Campylobacter iguaniorum TaxID=1244531 RepID=A0A076F9Q3_9BACT|nr:flagellar biosynthesis protein FlhB [Campylobacter iguaniorum]AII14227.1 flagellar export apparatus, flagellar biosynthetic protein FlhB [Campylobacter iguaniorum]ALV23966.1 flagellar export apparatus, flagellar biosynthetic protein FlhB [Campylobacter iguaniorum]